MKCPECGSDVGPGEQFCGNCGAPVETSEALPDDAQERFGDETVIAEAPVIPPLEPQEPDFAPPPPPVAGAGGEGKKKTGMIVAIVAIVVIILCCCCIAAVVMLLNSDVGQELLYELGLTMRPLLTTLVV